ncbi:MAG: cytosine/adenosine deaminase-related metal-dependent hydrolase [Planctomycetota bacterium]|jgi:cytosine/adenosine deaminase-related metal-dependent hydrolase
MIGSMRRDQAESEQEPKVLWAPGVLVDSENLHLGGAALVLRAGRVVECVPGLAAARRSANRMGVALEDLGRGILTPGLVNAHSHLELHDLAGEVSGSGGFGAWIGKLMALRAGREPEALARGVHAGARRLAQTGTTAVGDIDSLGLSEQGLRASGLRVVHYREALDAGDAARTAGVLQTMEALPDGSDLLHPGLAPHAPYTVSPGLWQGLGELATRRELQVTVHWAETEAEVDWLAGRGGPLAGLLGTPPGPSGLDLIEAAGLLGPHTSLVHGNLPAPGEVQRVAQAGSVVVHCPGTHAFFERERFPLEQYQAAGVCLALGTDSSASNVDLDMRAEMRALRRSHAELAPGEVWRMATSAASRALGLEAGCLEPGHAADLAWFAVEGSEAAEVLDFLTGELPEVLGTWISGVSRGASGSAP